MNLVMPASRPKKGACQYGTSASYVGPVFGLLDNLIRVIRERGHERCWLTFMGGLILCLSAGTSCESLLPIPVVTEDPSTQVLGFKPERPSWSPEESDTAGDEVEADKGMDAAVGSNVSESSAKAGWIRRASTAVSEHFERVDAYMWFNFEKERDWRVDSSTEALQAFQESWSGLAPGVFLPSFPGPTPIDASTIDSYEATVGTSQVRIGWHVALTGSFPTEAVRAVQHRGSIPYLVWEPYDPRTDGESARNGESRLDEIVAGAYDVFIDRWAHGAVAVGGPIEITFGHEMNGDWYTWGYGGGHNGNTPELFAEAYRYVHDRFESAGATNVQWVWTINASWRDDFSEAFPGADDVDRLGMNGFNFGGDPQAADAFWQSWREFEQIFGCWETGSAPCFSSYETLVSLADRPVIIGEFASAEWPGEGADLE